MRLLVNRTSHLLWFGFGTDQTKTTDTETETGKTETAAGSSGYGLDLFSVCTFFCIVIENIITIVYIVP